MLGHLPVTHISVICDIHWLILQKGTSLLWHKHRHIFVRKLKYIHMQRALTERNCHCTFSNGNIKLMYNTRYCTVLTSVFPIIDTTRIAPFYWCYAICSLERDYRAFSDKHAVNLYLLHVLPVYSRVSRRWFYIIITPNKYTWILYKHKFIATGMFFSFYLV